jgi:hypothetical protein
VVGGALVGVALLAPGAGARELTFEDRVRAQEALERVHHAHQIGTTKPFASAVPRAVLERKVRQYLDQSTALEVLWHTPITAEMLSRELERMMRQTMMPERLAELFSALGDDRFLIEECLARAALADRLSRNFFAYDGRVHAAERARVERLQADPQSGRIDPRAGHPSRHEATLSRDDEELEPGEYERLREQAGRFEETRDGFLLYVLLEEDAAEGRMRLATYHVPKAGWDDWWSDARQRFAGRHVGAVATGGAPPSRELLGGATPGCVPDSWSNGSLGVPPGPESRWAHSFVWTGSEMIIWGGLNGSTPSGSRYDPVTDVWSATSQVGAPSARYDHSAVWTGEQTATCSRFPEPVPRADRTTRSPTAGRRRRRWARHRRATPTRPSGLESG